MQTVIFIHLLCHGFLFLENDCLRCHALISPEHNPGLQTCLHLHEIVQTHSRSNPYLMNYVCEEEFFSNWMSRTDDAVLTRCAEHNARRKNNGCVKYCAVKILSMNRNRSIPQKKLLPDTDHDLQLSKRRHRIWRQNRIEQPIGCRCGQKCVQSCWTLFEEVPMHHVKKHAVRICKLLKGKSSKTYILQGLASILIHCMTQPCSLQKTFQQTCLSSSRSRCHLILTTAVRLRDVSFLRPWLNTDKKEKRENGDSLQSKRMKKGRFHVLKSRYLQKHRITFQKAYELWRGQREKGPRVLTARE